MTLEKLQQQIDEQQIVINALITNMMQSNAELLRLTLVLTECLVRSRTELDPGTK